MVHPLPKGEGWGEAERIARMPNALGAFGGGIKMRRFGQSWTKRIYIERGPEYSAEKMLGLVGCAVCPLH